MARLIHLRTTLALFAALSLGACGSDTSPTPPADPPPPPPPATYTVGGVVTGLAGPGLVLSSSFGGDLAISASGSFTFSTRVPDGGSFEVVVKTQPKSSPAQYCQIANNVGVITAANVTFVAVTCAKGYTVGGTVSGLVGSGLTLATCHVWTHGYSGGVACSNQHQVVGTNGAFMLDSVYPAGYSGPDYVSVTQQPTSPTQHCVIDNAVVSIQDANDTSVAVSCTGYAYVTNAADNTVSSYAVDASTGALAAIGTPTPTGTAPYAIVGVDTGMGTRTGIGKRYVYVGNEGSNDISAFAVDNTTGALTEVFGSPFPAGTDPKAMSLCGGLQSLCVANSGSGNVSVYTIDYSTGVLTALTWAPVSVRKNPTSTAFYNGNVFVANHGGSNDISAFHNLGLPVDGAAVPGSPFPAGGNPLSLAIGGGGTGTRFLYSANPDVTKPSISAFSIDLAGPLTRLSGSPFPFPVSRYIATDQTGAYLYVTSGATVVGYGIDATTGALTALQGFPVNAGANAYSITIDQSNQFLYVVNEGDANISGFRLDAATGALTPMPGPPFAAGNHPGFLATF
jgi:6-phosphogluconolactonase